MTKQNVRRKTSEGARRKRARQVLAITPGMLSLYVAYAVVIFRLLMIALQGMDPTAA